MAEEKKAMRELHQCWENEEMIRSRFREHGSLLLWGNDKIVGVPCMANVAINYKVLIVFQDFFCPLQKGPKSPRVGFIRAQVWLFKKNTGEILGNPKCFEQKVCNIIISHIHSNFGGPLRSRNFALCWVLFRMLFVFTKTVGV